jgi:hypothetical protein
MNISFKINDLSLIELIGITYQPLFVYYPAPLSNQRAVRLFKQIRYLKRTLTVEFPYTSS